MSASDYSKGLRHGREDLAKMIAEILAMDISDEVKLERLGWLAVPLAEAVIELPDERPAGCLGDGKCTNPRCPRHGVAEGTQWERHDDPELPD